MPSNMGLCPTVTPGPAGCAGAPSLTGIKPRIIGATATRCNGSARTATPPAGAGCSLPNRTRRPTILAPAAQTPGGRDPCREVLAPFSGSRFRASGSVRPDHLAAGAGDQGRQGAGAQGRAEEVDGAIDEEVVGPAAVEAVD